MLNLQTKLSNKILNPNFNLNKLHSRTFKAAVLLSGCGVYDGSEITESAAMLIALSKNNVSYQCYAPDKDQMHTINHINGEELDQKRNVLVESARIARGNVKPLSELNCNQYDALFLPGGFGAAKNLSDFAVKGIEMTVDPQVERVVLDFQKSNKQMGLACISPVIAAKIFGQNQNSCSQITDGAMLTLGSKGDSWPFSGSIDAAKSLGNKIVEMGVSDVCFDQESKIFTTPAQMKNDATPQQVYQGISKMVDSVINKSRNKNNIESVEGIETATMPICLIVHVEVVSEHLNTFLDVIGKNAQGSRHEEGCQRWDLLKDTDNECKFTFFEVQKDKAAIEFHKTTEHYKGWDQIKNQGIAKVTGKIVMNAIDQSI